MLWGWYVVKEPTSNIMRCVLSAVRCFATSAFHDYFALKKHVRAWKHRLRGCDSVVAAFVGLQSRWMIALYPYVPHASLIYMMLSLAWSL